ncbi:hypothetical protein ACJX0J_024824 [Zea mays]
MGIIKAFIIDEILEAHHQGNFSNEVVIAINSLNNFYSNWMMISEHYSSFWEGEAATLTTPILVQYAQHTTCITLPSHMSLMSQNPEAITTVTSEILFWDLYIISTKD